MKCFYYLKDKSRNGKQRPAPELNHQTKLGVVELYEEKAPNLRVFSLSQLRQATHDFNRLLKIGEGGFGCVYRGTIKLDSGNGDPDTIDVAIKRLNRDGFQGHKQWVAEVQFLGVVEHPNVVKLIGYCGVDGERGIQRLLVYEYMANRSLEDHLFNRAYPALDWNTRLQILLGAAQGLDYLHEGLQIQVIFRDFKSSNVLLDEKFNPKLSDFGLAREGPMPDKTHVSTTVVGTQGYAAPDYIQTGHLTTKSDVWSFGVVIYEVLTGRRSLNRNLPKPEQKLLEWVKQYPPESKKFGSIIDPGLENHYSINTARKVAKLADRCLLKSPKDRPTMREVVECLRQIVSGSGEGSENGSMEWLEGSENEPSGSSQGEVTESWRRRMAHLAKLGEHAEGAASRRRFIFLQRAKVP